MPHIYIIKNKENNKCYIGQTKYSPNYRFKKHKQKSKKYECARLQGYPDFYHNGISNSQAYKCYGNSFTVPIIEHLLKHIFI